MGLRSVRLQLPEHLAKWLEDISEQLAMTPSQLVANILSYYYEVWTAGRKAAPMGEAAGTGLGRGFELQRKVEQFLNENKTIHHNAFIVRSFASWLSRKGLDLKDVNESLIERFLEEYSFSRKVTGITKDTYKKALRKFLNFVKGKQ